MVRYIGPKQKLARREGMDLFLKSGLRCYETKCKSHTQPGQHGHTGRKLSAFAVRFREKQKIKRMYGLTETQLVKYVKQASRQHGSIGDALLQILEQRLDNVVYRLGFCPTRASARQLVVHRFVNVNNKIVNVPSFQVQVGMTVNVRLQSRISQPLQQCPSWLCANDGVSGLMNAVPCRDAITESITERLVVEFYSRLV